MSRKLWGEFEEDDEVEKERKIVPTKLKQAKLDEVAGGGLPQGAGININLKLRGSLLTQTIEANKQTEMLQSLIETFSNKTEGLPMPAQVIPKVDFPVENSTDFTNDTKFARPLNFIPPQTTPFTEGAAKSFPEITQEVCKAAFRKAICGLLISAGFTFSNESALVLFADAAEEHLRKFLEHIREIQSMDSKMELNNEIHLHSLEKAYHSFSNQSILGLHNYFKRQIIEKNQKEVAGFQKVFDEYDKLRKESEELQAEEEAKQIATIIQQEAPITEEEDDDDDDGTASGGKNLNGHSSSFMNILDELMKTPTDMEANAAIKDDSETDSN